MQTSLFSKKAKLADVISAHYELLSILPRFEILLGFRDKSIEEVCQEKQIPTDLFLLVCKIYASENFAPDLQSIRQLKITELIKYLRNSHKDYLENQIPHLRKHLNDLLAQIPNNPEYVQLMNQFMDQYILDLEKHFEEEEEVVFPYVERLLAKKQNKKYCIHDFEENHSNIEEKLSDLINIILKYLPEQLGGSLRSHMLFLLFSLETDIRKHTLLENNLLIPAVSNLEKEIHG